jgi:hypothetical protein
VHEVIVHLYQLAGRRMGAFIHLRGDDLLCRPGDGEGNQPDGQPQ